MSGIISPTCSKTVRCCGFKRELEDAVLHISIMSIIIIVNAACRAAGDIGAMGGNCGLKLVGRISVPVSTVPAGGKTVPARVAPDVDGNEFP